MLVDIMRGLGGDHRGIVLQRLALRAWIYYTSRQTCIRCAVVCFMPKCNAGVCGRRRSNCLYCTGTERYLYHQATN